MDFAILVKFVLLATFGSPVAGTLIVKPRDTDVKVNQSTYFNCSTDLSAAIFWYHGENIVYTVQGILELYQNRFEIDRYMWNGTHIYNLIIHSVQIGDAGEYKCAEDEGIGEKHSVQLVVLDGDPICRSNIDLNEVIGQNTCNVHVEPDEVELSCIVMYHGNIPPQLEWKKDGDDGRISEGLSNIRSGNHYNYILKLKGDISLDKSSYICETTRIAHEPRTCTSEVINVLYAIGDNSTTNRRVGDEILCGANTTQSCSYQWRWFKNNDVTTESSLAILIPTKSGLHKCEAECSLRNETCNLLVMSVVVSESAESTQGKNASISVPVVVAVVVTLVVLVAVLLIVFRHRIAGYWNKERNAKLALRPKKNIGSVSAWSFFYGYLRLVLPDFQKRLIKETLSDYPERAPKTVQKMLIIIPESCFCAASLVVPTKIEFTGMFVKSVASRAGNQERDYKSSLFKLIDQEKDEEYYFVGEFATPLLTMYETCTSALGGMTKDELYDERDGFYIALQDILSHRNHTEHNDQIKLLYWSDPETKKPNQLDIYNFLLQELRKEIKLQQNATGENVSPNTNEDESTPLNKPPENKRQSGLKVKLKKNIGSASSWSYFYGYLRFVLPDFKKRLIEETLSDYPDLVPKTIQKMLIIMPESCICAKSLEVTNKIELTGMFVKRVVSRAGNPEHEYKSPLFKLIGQEKNEEYYFVGELPTSLLTMYETCTSALGGMTKNQLYAERDAFYSTLRAILSHRDHADCNQFKLLNWSDLETKKRNQLDIYNFLLLELRKEIKLQQQNENNIGTVRTDINVHRSSNAIEMSPIA